MDMYQRVPKVKYLVAIAEDSSRTDTPDEVEQAMRNSQLGFERLNSGRSWLLVHDGSDSIFHDLHSKAHLHATPLERTEKPGCSLHRCNLAVAEVVRENMSPDEIAAHVPQNLRQRWQLR